MKNAQKTSIYYNSYNVINTVIEFADKAKQKFKDQLDSPRQGRYKSKLRMEQQYKERQLLDKRHYSNNVYV